MKTCVIIPTYNESREIGGLVKQIRDLVPEVIVIDDGSSDDTAGIAYASGAIVLRNQENKGKGACLIKGYAYALSRGFDAVISMDGDGQHSVQDLPAFIKEAEECPDSAMIVGNRMANVKNMPFLRVATNYLMSRFLSLVTKQYIPDTQCGYRLLKRSLLEKINLSTSKYETESEILIKAGRLGFKIKSIPIKTIYGGQKSQINPLVDTLRFIRFIWAEFCKGGSGERI